MRREDPRSLFSDCTQLFGAFAGNVTWLVDTLVLGSVAFRAAALVCHRVKEEWVNVDGTAGHPGRKIDHRTMHASFLNQEALAHKSSHVRVLSHTQYRIRMTVLGNTLFKVQNLINMHITRRLAVY